MKEYKYLIKPDGNWSYVKIDVNAINLPEGWSISDSKPAFNLSAFAINKRRDELSEESPLQTPYGAVDFKKLDREKQTICRNALVSLDAQDPANAPHTIDWTMADNTIVPLTSQQFDVINIAAAIRGRDLHETAKRLKHALATNTPADPADLQRFGLN